MNLKDLLSEKKPAILSRWFDFILETYPPDTSKFLKNQKNRFANPVGAAISQGIEEILDELLRGAKREKVSQFLDNIIRVRAVQEFTASEAVSVIFLLKKAIRESMGEEIRENRLQDELLRFETEIDDLALISFDIFMGCREKLYEIKANEMKNMTYRLLQKANMICEDPEKEPEPNHSDFLNIKRKEVPK